MLAFIGGIGIAELVILSLVFFIPLILWVWALIDLLRSDFEDSITKLIWVIIIIFIPFFGALLYLIMGRNQKVDTKQKFDF